MPSRAITGFGSFYLVAFPFFLFFLCSFFPPALQIARAQPSLLIVQAPKGEVLSDSLVTITITPFPPATASIPDSCGIYYQKTPKGNVFAGHDLRLKNLSVTVAPDRSSATFSFRPADPAPGGSPQMGLGFHYLVAACGDGTLHTPEYPLLVVTRQAPTLISPNTEEKSALPQFTWTAVPGVPAYHLLLSDQPLVIDMEGGSVTGASITWQVITAGTSIAYGTPDPSGNFAKVEAPPLSSGVQYNCIVLNNFDGRSALATSTKAQSLKLFSVIPPGSQPLFPPRNLSPAPGSSLNSVSDSLITFRWTDSTSRANTYKIFVYMNESQAGSQVLVPIWQSEVTDTFAILNARSTLFDNRYLFKVFAVDEAGAGVVGDTSSFTYAIPVQELSVSTRALGPAGDTIGLGDVTVRVVPIQGSADPLPFFTVSGEEVKKKFPWGLYQIEFAKSGYVDQKRTVTLDATSLMRVSQFMPQSSSQVTGTVRDGTGLALSNVMVSAKGGGGKVFSASGNAQGFFLLGLSPGSYAFNFSKSDYKSPKDTVVTISPGQNISLGTIVLTRIASSITGTVSNDKGQPLPAAKVEIRGPPPQLLRVLQTDSKGRFSAFVSPGAFTVSASKTGFTSAEKTIQLSENADLQFQLASGASILKGRILIDSRLTATETTTSPAAGAALSLFPSAVTGSRQSATSDNQGDFAFSVGDTGTYTLVAALPGKAEPETARVHVPTARSTVTASISLMQFARIAGKILFNPPLASATAAKLDAGQFTVNLLGDPSGALLASASPSMSQDILEYTLDGVPDGDYLISVGAEGYGMADEPEAQVRQGIWIRDLDLSLKPADKSIGFILKRGEETLEGSVDIQAPMFRTLGPGEKLSPAGEGAYTLSGIPTDPSLLPLESMRFRLGPGGSADTTLTLDFPFSHPQRPLEFRNRSLEVELLGLASIDSAFLAYGYDAPRDTLKIAGPRPANLPVTLEFNPGPQGGLLTYYFVVYSAGRRWANSTPGRWYRVSVPPSPELAYLRLGQGDSLRLPAGSRTVITLDAFDASGGRLNSEVDARALVVWESPSQAGLILENTSGRNPVLIASRTFTSATGGSEWLDFGVSVTLDEVHMRLPLAVKVEPRKINRLILASSLGEATDLASPTSFNLQVAAFDTLTQPPTPLLPNPAITLFPPAAGEVRESQVFLRPNFLGPLRITATHRNGPGDIVFTELGIHRDSLLRGLNVGQTIRPGDSSRLFFHDPGFEILLLDSALEGDGQAVLRMRKRSLAKTFTSEVKKELLGELYEISNPLGASFASKPVLKLGLGKEAAGRQGSVGRFDQGSLGWRALYDSAHSDLNSFGVAALAAPIMDFDGSLYGVLGASRALAASSLDIIPNPFSPLILASRDGNTEYGTRIRFRPESDRSARVTVSVKIYNMAGELIRLLVDHKTVPKGLVEYYWEGKTSDGRWARNGRYLVVVSLKEPGYPGTAYRKAPVVLFQ